MTVHYHIYIHMYFIVIYLCFCFSFTLCRRKFIINFDLLSLGHHKDRKWWKKVPMWHLSIFPTFLSFPLLSSPLFPSIHFTFQGSPKSSQEVCGAPYDYIQWVPSRQPVSGAFWVENHAPVIVLLQKFSHSQIRIMTSIDRATYGYMVLRVVTQGSA